MTLLPECKPLVNNRQNRNWEQVWRNLTFRYINIHEREIVFKFIHGILPTRARLFQIKRKDCPLFSLCNVPDDNMLMFIECKNKENILKYFKEILSRICDFCHTDINKTLYLYIKPKNKKQLNTVIVLTSQYISTIWFNRDRVSPLSPALFKVNMLKHQRLLTSVLQDDMSKVFMKKYCTLDY